MAMERFQRWRDLFADTKPAQSEMSLLDAPANGTYTMVVLTYTMTNPPQNLSLHEQLQESHHHDQPRLLSTHHARLDRSNVATGLVAHRHLYHQKTQETVYPCSDPEDFRHLQL